MAEYQQQKDENEEFSYLPRHRDKPKKDYTYLNEPVYVDEVTKEKKEDRFSHTDRPLVKPTTWDQIKIRAKHNPFAPLGLLMSFGFIIGGVYTLRTGNNYLNLRFNTYRIYSQVFTLFAIIGGEYHWSYIKEKEMIEAEQKQKSLQEELMS